MRRRCAVFLAGSTYFLLAQTTRLVAFSLMGGMGPRAGRFSFNIIKKPSKPKQNQIIGHAQQIRPLPHSYSYATTYCREGFEGEGFKKLSKRISFSHTPLSSSFRKFSGRAVSVVCRDTVGSLKPFARTPRACALARESASATERNKVEVEAPTRRTTDPPRRRHDWCVHLVHLLNDVCRVCRIF